jgi:hypothetical protein
MGEVIRFTEFDTKLPTGELYETKHINESRRDITRHR